MAAGDISFAGNDLQTATIFTQELEHESIEKNALLYELANVNRNVIPFVNYPKRVISASGRIIGSTIAECDGYIDTFKGYFRGIGQNLDIGYNSTTRRYIATAQAPRIIRPGGMAYADWSLEFLAQPFGQDTSATTAVTATARTSATYADDYTFLGSAPWQAPIIRVEINSLTGGTGKYIAIENAATGQQIMITRDWAADDVLLIDTYNRLVTVNDDIVAYTGGWPLFELGAGTINYSDNLTTRNIDYLVTYYKLYL